MPLAGSEYWTPTSGPPNIWRASGALNKYLFSSYSDMVHLVILICQLQFGHDKLWSGDPTRIWKQYERLGEYESPESLPNFKMEPKLVFLNLIWQKSEGGEGVDNDWKRYFREKIIAGQNPSNIILFHSTLLYRPLQHLDWFQSRKRNIQLNLMRK